MKLETAAKVFAELGNRTRLEILRLLIKAGPDGLAVGEIQRQLDMPASTLAFHLRGIVGAGLVEQKRRGRIVLCRPCFDGINDAVAFLNEECCMGIHAAVPRRKKVA